MNVVVRVVVARVVSVAIAVLGLGGGSGRGSLGLGLGLHIVCSKVEDGQRLAVDGPARCLCVWRRRHCSSGGVVGGSLALGHRMHRLEVLGAVSPLLEAGITHSASVRADALMYSTHMFVAI